MEDKKKTEGPIDPVNIEGTKKILDQLMNCICKIQIKGTNATGFFCKFSHKKQALMKRILERTKNYICH